MSKELQSRAAESSKEEQKAIRRSMEAEQGGEGLVSDNVSPKDEGKVASKSRKLTDSPSRLPPSLPPQNALKLLQANLLSESACDLAHLGLRRVLPQSAEEVAYLGGRDAGGASLVKQGEGFSDLGGSW